MERHRPLFLLVALLGLAACVGPSLRDRLGAGEPPAVELGEVPFFPQKAYECAPAALAMVLDSAGAEVQPDALTAQVYVPDRKGSLHAEMTAAVDRLGYVPYVLKPRLDAILAELSAGHPVLIFENLGLGWFPDWHYAVVVGFDRLRRSMILRSGLTRRDVVTMKAFLRAWDGGQDWAMVVMRPDQLPATAEELPYLESVAELERLKLWTAADTAYDV